MKITPIKKELRDLSYNDLEIQKSQIVMFLVNYPKVTKAEQGWATIAVLYDLMQAKIDKNELLEEVIKTLCFE